MHSISFPHDPQKTLTQALKHESGWILLQKKWAAWKSKKAFKKIEDTVGLNLLKLSNENLTCLRRETIGPTSHLSGVKKEASNSLSENQTSSLSPQEELFFNMFCDKLEFTFTHGTTSSNYAKLQHEGTIWSYDDLRRKKKTAKGLSANADVALGNTEMVYGVLGTPGSKFPILGDRRDAFIFDVKKFLNKTIEKPFMTRLSDWYWFETERELHPCLLGTTLRRVIHCIIDSERKKIYIYEHQNGESEFFMVRRGDEEFAGHSFKPAIALMMIKELRFVQKGDPEFYEKTFGIFSPELEDSPELQKQRKQLLTHLFHTLYSPESTVPSSLKLGLEGHDYLSSIGFSRKLDEIKTLHNFLKKGDLQGIREVLNNNPELIDAKYYGHTPLMTAAAAGNEEVVAFLLSNGADPYLKTNQEDLTALIFAILESRIEIVKLLLSYSKNNINDLIKPKDNDLEPHRWKRYSTPLILAGQIGNQEIIDLLLVAGARARKQHVVVSIPTYKSEKKRFFLLGQKCYRDTCKKLQPHGDMILPGCLKEEIVQDPLVAAKRNLKFLTSIEVENASSSIVFSSKKQGDNIGIEYQTDFVLVDCGKKLAPFSTGHLLNLRWVSETLLEKHKIKPSNKLILHNLHVDLSNHPLSEQLESSLYLETEGIELLHTAIRTNNLEKIEWLISQQVPVEGKINVYSIQRSDSGRYTPLMTAVKCERLEALKIVLRNRGNPNPGWGIAFKNRSTAIMTHLLHSPLLKLSLDFLRELTLKNDKKIIELIFKEIENVSNLSLDLLDASYFVKKENQYLLEVLLERKPQNKKFLFECASLAAASNELKIMELLSPLIKNWDRHPTSSPSSSPLHEACKANHTATALFLIKVGAGNFLARDYKNKVPLDYSLENENEEIITAITAQTFPYKIMNKYNVQIKEFFTTWISFFTREDAWKFYKIIKSAGCDCKRPDERAQISVLKTALCDFIDGVPLNNEPKKLAPAEFIKIVEKSFKFTPIKMERGYLTVDWDLFFNSEDVKVKDLFGDFKKAHSMHFDIKFCNEDNSITMTDYDFLHLKSIYSSTNESLQDYEKQDSSIKSSKHIDLSKFGSSFLSMKPIQYRFQRFQYNPFNVNPISSSSLTLSEETKHAGKSETKRHSLLNRDKPTSERL